ncbi:MAG: hypothetical protein AAF546_14635 [Verrucomicrobiota bacterium]
MNGKREIAIQAIVYVLLVVLCSFYVGSLRDGAISLEATLETLKTAFLKGWGMENLLIPPFLVLLFYNFSMAVFWWVRRFIKARESINISKIWKYPNNLLVFVMVFLFCGVFALEFFEKRTKRNLILDLFSSGTKEEVSDYKINRAINVEDHFFESEISEINIQNRYATVELKSGHAIMIVFRSHRKEVIIEKIW